MPKRGSFFGTEARYATLVAAGCHLEGKFTCRGLSLIGGVVDGDVLADDHLIIDMEATINGNIYAPVVEVSGRVNGVVNGKVEVILHPSAILEGDIVSPKVTVEGGAIFNGSAKMTERKTIAKPGLKAV